MIYIRDNLELYNLDLNLQVVIHEMVSGGGWGWGVVLKILNMYITYI